MHCDVATTSLLPYREGPKISYSGLHKGDNWTCHYCMELAFVVSCEVKAQSYAVESSAILPCTP